jgi:MSHA biogenesis protein MshK
MAASVNKLFLVGAGLLCAALPVQAFESLPDPTKPAVEIPYASETGLDVAASAVSAPKKEGLQSIIISPRHRAAIINGETVALGGKIGDATLVEVRENSVVLQSAQGKRVMELFPGVHLSKTELALQDKEQLQPKKLKNKKQKSTESDHIDQDKDKRKSK